ncbi:MAG: methionyl-tRNA formyltransferase [Anaerovoracaceae bacterium]|jgi:methionyl-tRNA formyltransferase
MKVVFMGTPQFAVPSLVALEEAGHDIRLVVTQPDAKRDRGKKFRPSPVKEKAMEMGVPILQPDKIKNNEEFLRAVADCKPDVMAVAAYGKILPKEILDIPSMGCINVHASLLPKYRGAGPVQRAVLEGEEKTGVTIMVMEEGLDTGDMLAKEETPIGRKTTEDLTGELAQMGGRLLVKTLALLERGEIKPEPQDESLASYAPLISKEDGRIDFSRPAVEIERQVRAMNPWPGAYTHYRGGLLKIWEADVISSSEQKTPGTITSAGSDGMVISTGEGALLAKTIQIPGKKRVPVAEYLKGNSIELFQVLG